VDVRSATQSYIYLGVKYVVYVLSVSTARACVLSHMTECFSYASRHSLLQHFIMWDILERSWTCTILLSVFYSLSAQLPSSQ
jgi:hypothetical protein